MKKANFFKLMAILAITILVTTNIYAQDFHFTHSAPSNILRTMENNANALFAEISRAYDKHDSYLNLSDKKLTTDAKKRIMDLWSINHFVCNEVGYLPLDVYPMYSINGYQVRNIPILIEIVLKDKNNHFKGYDYDFQSYVMTFDSSGTICDLTPMISMHDYNKIMATGNDVTKTRHSEKIVDFVENFRSAYDAKDSIGIEKMFSEDALIITGKVVNYAPNKETGSLINTQEIVYKVSDKKEYMTRLKNAFRANEYIHIDFENIDVIASEAIPNVYGVRLDQKWHSTNYSDEGELFLIIDYRDEEHPLVWVRAWQPYKDAKGNVIPYTEDQHFSLGRFIK